MKKAFLAAVALCAALLCSCAGGQSANTKTLEFGSYEMDYPAKWGEPTEYVADYYYNTSANEYRWKFSEVQSFMVVDVSGNGIYSGDFLAKVRENNSSGETDFINVNGEDATSTWFTYDTVYRKKVIFGYDGAELTFIVTMDFTDMPSSDEWKEMEKAASTIRRAE